MVDEPRRFPFPSLRRAVEYIEFGNPARSRSLNIFEPERGSKPAFAQFSGMHPADIHASVVAGFERVLSETPPGEAQFAAVMFWRLTREVTNERRDGKRFTKEVVSKETFSVDEIADWLGCSDKKVYRLLKSFNEALRAEYVERGLLEPPAPTKYDA